MVNRKLSLILIVSVLMTLFGCGNGENTIAQDDTSFQPVQDDELALETEQQNVGEVIANESKENQETEDEVDKERTKAIKDYMYENYGTPGYAASWYALIKDIRVSGETVYIETSIYPDEEGKQTAQLICNTVAYSDHVTADDYVIVKNQNGLSFASCYRLD